MNQSFDPNGVRMINQGVFGLPFTVAESKLVIIPAPFDATVSFREGTANGPAAVLAASPQIDLHDMDFLDEWKKGIAMMPFPSEYFLSYYQRLRCRAKDCITHLEEGGSTDDFPEEWARVNKGCEIFKQHILSQSLKLLNQNKIVAVLGGDHSVSLGLIKALRRKHKYPFDIVQLDAHLDLREEYEGFTLSHASAMCNAMQEAGGTLIQVGARDFCQKEIDYTESIPARIHTSKAIHEGIFRGAVWDGICDIIIRDMSENVFISFDIDALDPSLCPDTGTPVPGGLSFEQAVYLIKKIVHSGRHILGFDLCEVAPAKNGRWESDWNAIVGSRILYQLAIATLASQP